MRRPLCLFCLVFVLLVITVTEIFPYEYGFSDIESGKTVFMEGIVSQKDVRKKENQITYIIYLEQIKLVSVSDAGQNSNKDSTMNKLNKAEGLICYMAEDSYVPNIGSYVQVTGKISPFESPQNAGEFDAPLYYKTKGADARVFECELTAYGNEYSIWKEKLFRVKQGFCDILDTYFKPEYAGIAKAILFAMNTELDSQTKELYQRNGMLHILCVSGLHVSILGMGLFRILTKMGVPDKGNAALCIGCMFLYGVMIGMGTSVFRAILMFSLNIAAKLLKRTYDLMTAACVGALAILLEEPLYIYHSGFLLSFLSVIALAAFRQLFPKKVCENEFLNKRMDGFLSGLTVWIVTLPIYGRCYYEVSVSGLLLNVLILPFVSIVLVLVMCVCTLGYFFSPAGIFFANACECFLQMFELFFELVEQLGKTSLVLGYFPLYKCFYFYIVLTTLLLFAKKIKKRWVYIIMMLLCWSVVLKIPKDLTITCLSVGQGDCAVIEYKNVVCVVDAGSSTKSELGKYTLLPFLKYQGVRSVDYLFLSHSDSDHINAVESLIRQSKNGITIKRLVVTDVKYESEYGEIFELAKAQDVKIYEMQKGDFITEKELHIECLSPDEEILRTTKTADNATSMVLLLTHNDFSMLFTGDTEGDGEALVSEKFQKENQGSVSVLKVAHHGSKNSGSEEFLMAVHPKASIISCGKNNRYGHPHKETLDRLKLAESTVLTTPECGQITIRVHEGKMEIFQFLKQKE